MNYIQLKQKELEIIKELQKMGKLKLKPDAIYKLRMRVYSLSKVLEKVYDGWNS